MRIPKVGESIQDKKQSIDIEYIWNFYWRSFVFMSEWDRKASPERGIWRLQSDS